MKYRTRTFYTDKQKSEMWDRWQRGESLSSIGRRFDRASSSIFPHLALTGGIRPAARTRSRLALSLIEREEISRGLATGRSLRSIARDLRRAPSTVSREVRRNGGVPGHRAKAAAEVVPTADCGVVDAQAPERRARARVARNNLSQPIRTDAWCPEERTSAMPAQPPRHPSVPACNAEGAEAAKDQECDPNQ